MDLDHKPLAHLLGYKLARASIQADQVFHESIGAPLKLRPIEFTVLSLIGANTEVTAKKLSSTLTLSAPNMSLMIERLEKRGLLRRAQSGADKRALLLDLTAKGRALAAQAAKVSVQMEDHLLSRLTAGERAILFELLDKVIAPGRADTVGQRSAPGTPVSYKA